MHTTEQLAKRFGKSTRTITTWASQADLGKPKYNRRTKRREFTDEDVAKIMAVAGIDEDATEPAAIVVSTGNHQTVLDQPPPPTDLTLENLRIGENVSFEDPLAVAESIVNAANVVVRSMRQDAATRYSQLVATNQAVSQVKAAIAELRQEQLVYRLQTAPVDRDTTQATQELQQALGELQKLRGDSSHV